MAFIYKRICKECKGEFETYSSSISTCNNCYSIKKPTFSAKKPASSVPKKCNHRKYYNYVYKRDQEWYDHHPYTIKEWLELHIVEFGCSRKEIAKAFNISRQAISLKTQRWKLYEKRRSFRKEKVKKFCSNLELSISEIEKELEKYRICGYYLINYLSRKKDRRYLNQLEKRRLRRKPLRKKHIFIEGEKELRQQRMTKAMTRLWSDPDRAKR